MVRDVVARHAPGLGAKPHEHSYQVQAAFRSGLRPGASACEPDRIRCHGWGRRRFDRGTRRYWRRHRLWRRHRRLGRGRWPRRLRFGRWPGGSGGRDRSTGVRCRLGHSAGVQHRLGRRPIGQVRRGHGRERGRKAPSAAGVGSGIGLGSGGGPGTGSGSGPAAPLVSPQLAGDAPPVSATVWLVMPERYPPGERCKLRAGHRPRPRVRTSEIRSPQREEARSDRREVAISLLMSGSARSQSSHPPT